MSSGLKILLLFFIILSGCQPTYTPPMGGGTLLPVPFGSTGCPYGYYEYLPPGYGQNSTQVYPMIISLHGAKLRGKSHKDPKQLEVLLSTGLPKLLEDEQFQLPEPMIVIALQTEYGFDANNLHRSIKWLIKTYQTDHQRVYLTGFNMGAFATFRYLGTYGIRSKIAAAVPIAGGGNIQKVEKIKETPIWAFHSLDDRIIDPQGSLKIIQAISKVQPSIPPRLTMYEQIGHECWNLTYTSEGMGMESPEYDPFNMDIFTWMLQYHKE